MNDIITFIKRKKIGTINFGLQTIKIITKGEITLVNKEEKAKTKKK